MQALNLINHLEGLDDDVVSIEIDGIEYDIEVDRVEPAKILLKPIRYEFIESPTGKNPGS